MNNRVQGAGHAVLEGDTEAFPGDLFLPEQPQASQFPFHDPGQSRPSSLQGLLSTPHHPGSSGWDLAQS